MNPMIIEAIKTGESREVNIKGVGIAYIRSGASIVRAEVGPDGQRWSERFVCAIAGGKPVFTGAAHASIVRAVSRKAKWFCDNGWTRDRAIARAIGESEAFVEWGQVETN